LDRNNQITPRAVQVGKIATAMKIYKNELWEAHKEPVVGVLTDWQNEAVWAAMSQAGRDEFKDAPIKARIGVSRALINANVPFEYVTVRDINAGLAMRYKVIYLPAILAVSKDLLSKLTAYVNEGGRLVMDLPSAWYDENGALLNTAKGSDFEKLFGATLNDFQYSGVNRVYKINGLAIKGFTADISVTTAKTAATYDNGKTAITENRLGKGTSVLLGYEASTVCAKPDNSGMEQLLVKNSLSNYVSPYSCEGAIVYRLSNANADHYFVMNDGPTKKVTLKTIFNYGQAKDAITGEKLLLNGPIALEANSARWIRVEKITGQENLVK
jgi:beta-galactosidase